MPARVFLSIKVEAGSMCLCPCPFGNDFAEVIWETSTRMRRGVRCTVMSPWRLRSERLIFIASKIVLREQSRTCGTFLMILWSHKEWVDEVSVGCLRGFGWLYVLEPCPASWSVSFISFLCDQTLLLFQFARIEGLNVRNLRWLKSRFMTWMTWWWRTFRRLDIFA